jgi:hypothetical protein
VVFQEHIPVVASTTDALIEIPGNPEPMSEPQRHRRAEAGKSARGKRKIRFQEPIELYERLLEEDDVVQLVRGDIRLPETVGDGIDRESMIVLLPSEPFLLRGRDDLAITDESRRGVVEEGGNPEYADTSHTTLTPAAADV